MLNIVEEIAGKAKERVVSAKKKISLSELKSKVSDQNTETDFPFEQALRGQGLRFICEVKKASPSKGVIAEHFPYVEIAKAYETAGASALSVLTEPYYFQGSNEYLREIKKQVKLPVLRKDFVVDEYMIYEAKTLGADAVLLICSILSDEQLAEYAYLAKSIGMTALVEAHDEAEIKRAITCKASVIGVNNRNLKDFTVDIENSVRLRQLVPKEIIFVSESGIKTAEDTKRLRENGTDAVLIGETLMRSGNIKKTLQELM